MQEITQVTCKEVFGYGPHEHIIIGKQYQVVGRNDEERKVRIIGERKRHVWIPFHYFEEPLHEEFQLSFGWNRAPELDEEDIRLQCCEAKVDFADGRAYDIYISSYKGLELEVRKNKETGENHNGLYLMPSHLYVEELSRDCIERSLFDLLKYGELEDSLGEYIFGIRFLPPWEGMTNADEHYALEEKVAEELKKEISETHPLFGCELDLRSYRPDTEEYLFHLGYNKPVVVTPTWSGQQEPEGLPKAVFYCNEREFWEQRLRWDIQGFG